MDIVRLCLKMVGKRRFPRWIIGNDQGQVWNKFGWFPPNHERGGQLFADMNSVHGAARLIQCLQHGEKKYRQVFRFPCTVEVYSDSPIRVGELRQWLDLALQYWLDYFAHGNGPKGSGVVSMAELSKLKQVRLKRHHRAAARVDHTKSFVIDVAWQSTTSW
jgi:hypothetical protein